MIAELYRRLEYHVARRVLSWKLRVIERNARLCMAAIRDPRSSWQTRAQAVAYLEDAMRCMAKVNATLRIDKTNSPAVEESHGHE